MGKWACGAIERQLPQGIAGQHPSPSIPILDSEGFDKNFLKLSMEK